MLGRAAHVALQAPQPSATQAEVTCLGDNGRIALGLHRIRHQSSSPSLLSSVIEARACCSSIVSQNRHGGPKVAHPERQAFVPPRPACAAIDDGGTLEPLLRQTCGVCGAEVTVRNHDRDAPLPGLVEVQGPRAWRLAPLLVWTTYPPSKGPGDPRLIDVFLSPIGLWRQHGFTFPRSAAWRMPRHRRCPRIGVQSEDELTYVARPIPAPALHTENGHHALHTRCEQRQRIKRPLQTHSGLALARSAAALK